MKAHYNSGKPAQLRALANAQEPATKNANTQEPVKNGFASQSNEAVQSHETIPNQNTIGMRHSHMIDYSVAQRTFKQEGSAKDSKKAIGRVKTNLSTLGKAALEWFTEHELHGIVIQTLTGQTKLAGAMGLTLPAYFDPDCGKLDDYDLKYARQVDVGKENHKAHYVITIQISLDQLKKEGETPSSAVIEQVLQHEIEQHLVPRYLKLTSMMAYLQELSPKERSDYRQEEEKEKKGGSTKNDHADINNLIRVWETYAYTARGDAFTGEDEWLAYLSLAWKDVRRLFSETLKARKFTAENARSLLILIGCFEQVLIEKTPKRKYVGFEKEFALMKRQIKGNTVKA